MVCTISTKNQINKKIPFILKIKQKTYPVYTCRENTYSYHANMLFIFYLGDLFFLKGKQNKTLTLKGKNLITKPS